MYTINQNLRYHILDTTAWATGHSWESIQELCVGDPDCDDCGRKWLRPLQRLEETNASGSVKGAGNAQKSNPADDPLHNALSAYLHSLG